ncbi:trigger factor [Mycoplasmopsis californica]|uniref:Trigger factor n=1 Tax=Mycoplasmopsis equigenitalium TaxID=114883 RepID=A0ABY5J0R0_9BACT|nr:hypothetical protein [Mycoplasmopsis equigenitalium]UUD36852.1 hypothetical protein NPA09_03055 [Mycoplasmopsis equigenitalium]VEU69852.1 trigger factor [Mycoplasmopsis californica]
MIVPGTELIWSSKIEGDELKDILTTLKGKYGDTWNTTNKNGSRWFLYETYANDLAKKVREEKKKENKLVRFIDSSFEYKFINDYIDLSIQYSEYALSDKSVIVRLKDNSIELPVVNQKHIDEIIENMEYEQAKFTPVKAKITQKHAILADITVFNNGQEIKELSVQNKQLIVARIDDEFGMLSNILGMKKGETKDFVFTPQNEKFKEISLNCKVSIYEVYDIKKPALDDKYVKTLKIKDVNTIAEFKAFLHLQQKLEVMEKFMTNYLKKISPEIINISKIDIPASFINCFYIANSLKEQVRINKEFGGLKNYLSISKITEEQLNEGIWRYSTLEAMYEILKFEIHSKYVYKRDEKLFKEFEETVVKAHNKVDFDIRDDFNYKQKMGNSYQILETFLAIVSLSNQVFYKEHFKDKKFPFI